MRELKDAQNQGPLRLESIEDTSIAANVVSRVEDMIEILNEEMENPPTIPPGSQYDSFNTQEKKESDNGTETTFSRFWALYSDPGNEEEQVMSDEKSVVTLDM